MCALPQDEQASPDGATYMTTAVDSCTRVPTSTDTAGDPVNGTIHCEGASARCAE